MRTLRKFLFTFVLMSVLLRSIGTCVVLTSHQPPLLSETASGYSSVLPVHEIQSVDWKQASKQPIREVGFKYLSAFVTVTRWDPLIAAINAVPDSTPPPLYSVSLGIPSKPPCV